MWHSFIDSILSTSKSIRPEAKPQYGNSFSLQEDLCFNKQQTKGNKEIRHQNYHILISNNAI